MTHTPLCTKIQETLIEQGPAAFEGDEAACQHLVECAECFGFLEAMGDLDGALEALPAIYAPDDLVARTLQAVAGDPAVGEAVVEESRESVWRRWTRSLRGLWRVPYLKPIAGVAGAGMTLTLALALVVNLTLQPGGLADTKTTSSEGRGIKGATAGSGSKAKGDRGEVDGGKRGDLDGLASDQSQMWRAADGSDTGTDTGTSEDGELDTIPDRFAEIITPEEATPAAMPPAPAEGRGGVESRNERRRDLAARGSPHSKEHSRGEELQRSQREPLDKSDQALDLPISDDGDGLVSYDSLTTAGPSGLRGQETRDTLESTRRLDVSQKGKIDEKKMEIGLRPPQDDSEVAPSSSIEVATQPARGLVTLDREGQHQPLDLLLDPTTITNLDAVNGADEGRLGWLGEGEGLWISLGLLDGDVIDQVDGTPVSSPAQALEQIRNLSATTFTLRVQRHGLPVFLTCSGDVAAPETLRCHERLSDRGVRDPRARAFLDDHRRLDGLTFQDPDGYWANTYVPGDPAMRLLESRLLGFDRAALSTAAGGTLHLDDLARQTTQPFDFPTSSALAVYLDATEAGATERTRMVVQVGLQGTPRRSGRRPAMNVAMVLDLRHDLSPEASAGARALLGALHQQRDLGDRFSLVVAGQPGGLVVDASEFRHGPLAVAEQSLFGDGAPADGPTLDLAEAYQVAAQTVRDADVPTAPLGSSVVLLVTAATLGDAVAELEALAHEQATGGVPLSVVGVGGAVDLAELDRLALAGQGNRRLLGQTDEAEGLVDRELSAVSGVVARAVRLRIRLAPGVELVDVLGSHRLDQVRAEQVRQAEQSIDQRMARNLGIEADRGDDEEGIQIVIPSYYAGDAHVVLLDVVVPGPGPVADVTVRYKDLVYSRNGVARDNLTLERREVAAGPLERNVLKNVLAHEMSRSLWDAAEQLHAGNNVAASATIHDQHQLLVALREELPGLHGDLDLGRDIEMLREYASMLGTLWVVSWPTHRNQLVASLQYAGLLKVLPRPGLE